MSLIPKIHSFDRNDDEYLNRREKKLIRFYKCPFLYDKCYFASDNYDTFIKHFNDHRNEIIKCSELKCYYCDVSINVTATDDDDRYKQFTHSFVSHLAIVHCQRVFQCNLCLFRAITENHILIHQASQHPNQCIEMSLKNIEINVKDHYNDISKVCKVIHCLPIVAHPQSNALIRMASLPKEAADIKDGKFHCLYCDYTNTDDISTIQHTVLTHPDFEISFWDGKRDDESNESHHQIEEINDESVYDDNRSESTNAAVKCEAPDVIPGFEQRYDTDDDDDDEPQNEPFKNNYLFNCNYNERNGHELGPYDFVIDRIGDNRNVPVEPQFNDSVKRRLDYHDYDYLNKRVKTENEYLDYDSRPLPPPIELDTNFESSTEVQKPSHTVTNRPDSVAKRPKVDDANANRIERSKNSAEESSKESGKKSVTEVRSSHKTQGKRKKRYARELLSSDDENHADDRGDDYRMKGYEKILRNESNEPEVPKRISRVESKKYFNPQPIGKGSAIERNQFKCLLCNGPNAIFFESKISQHLHTAHCTNSSLKCGISGCKFLGDSETISEHSKEAHPNDKHRVIKFIVPKQLDKSTSYKGSKFVTSVGVKHHNPKPKGALLTQIKESIFLGPLRNERTQKSMESTNGGKSVKSNHKPSIVKTSIVNRRKVIKGYDPKSVASNPFSFAKKPIPKPNATVTSAAVTKPKQVTEPTPSVSKPYESLVRILSDNTSQSPEKSDLSKESAPRQCAKKSTAKLRDYAINKSHVVKDAIEKSQIAKKSSSGKLRLPFESKLSKMSKMKQISSKFFCLFCESILPDKSLAIGHYKIHLELGLHCNECHSYVSQVSQTYHQTMTSHYKQHHPSLMSSIAYNTKNPKEINLWIDTFITNQMTNSELVYRNTINISKESYEISLKCPICVKAADLYCRVENRNDVIAKPFSKLWEIEAHICEHLSWNSRICLICKQKGKEISITDHRIPLSDHLLNDHYSYGQIAYLFEDHTPDCGFNKYQKNFINTHFESAKIELSHSLNDCLSQNLSKVRFDYENELRKKYSIISEVKIMVLRMTEIKQEKIDPDFESIRNVVSQESQNVQPQNIESQNAQSSKFGDDSQQKINNNKVLTEPIKEPNTKGNANGEGSSQISVIELDDEPEDDCIVLSSDDE